MYIYIYMDIYIYTKYYQIEVTYTQKFEALIDSGA